MKKIIAVLGPTATGKTDLAFQLARKFQGELIAADSRQVYRGLDIGTGKMPSRKMTLEKSKGSWKINGVKVWMYDVVDPKKQYSVASYAKDANQVINKIFKKGKRPILVGGTGLYFKALLEGLSNLGIPMDMQLRKILSSLSLEQLQKRLQELSPKKWKDINNSDRQNPRRLIRAIELSTLSLRGVKRSRLRSGLIARDDKVLKIGLTASREIIYERINNKALEWVELGVVDEVRNLLKKGVTKKRITELGLEYAVIVEYLDEKISLDQMIEKMQNKVRQYAKRQMTWFKKEKEVYWFNITDKNFVPKVEELVNKWYDSVK